MQYYYGAQNILRALDEAEFWKRQEAEHAGLIPVVTPGLEPEYIHQLEQFGAAFSTMNAEALQYIQSVNRSKGAIGRELNNQMLNFVENCIGQSQGFVALLTEMLQNSHAVMSNATAPTLLNHMIRESQYFVGIDQLILQ